MSATHKLYVLVGVLLATTYSASVVAQSGTVIQPDSLNSNEFQELDPEDYDGDYPVDAFEVEDADSESYGEDEYAVLDPDDEYYPGDEYSSDYLIDPLWDTLPPRPATLISAAEWAAISEGHSYPRENEEETEERKKERNRAANPGLDFGDGFLQGVDAIAWILIVALILGAIGYLLYRQRRDTSVTVNRDAYGVTDELLEASPEELQSQLDQHLAQGDYLNAIRYRFGQVLQSLRQRRLLTWIPGNTNQDYQEQLPEGYQHNFGRIASAFAYAFYAGRVVDQEQYQRFSQQVEEFDVQLGAASSNPDPRL